MGGSVSVYLPEELMQWVKAHCNSPSEWMQDHIRLAMSNSREYVESCTDYHQRRIEYHQAQIAWLKNEQVEVTKKQEEKGQELLKSDAMKRLLMGYEYRLTPGIRLPHAGKELAYRWLTGPAQQDDLKEIGMNASDFMIWYERYEKHKEREHEE